MLCAGALLMGKILIVQPEIELSLVSNIKPCAKSAMWLHCKAPWAKQSSKERRGFFVVIISRMRYPDTPSHYKMSYKSIVSWWDCLNCTYNFTNKTHLSQKRQEEKPYVFKCDKVVRCICELWNWSENDRYVILDMEVIIRRTCLLYFPSKYNIIVTSQLLFSSLLGSEQHVWSTSLPCRSLSQSLHVSVSTFFIVAYSNSDSDE